MSTIEKPAYMTPADVARELNVDEDTVRAWIAKRQLIAADVSRGAGQRPRWRISRADLEAFLQRRRTVDAPKPERRKRPAVLIPRHV